MSSKIYFIKNMAHEAAGLFSSIAEQEGIPFEIVDLDRGQGFPEVLNGDVVVVLGGPDSANDRSSKILKELTALQKCLREGVPLLGVCLGLQLLVKADGGTVFRNPVKEVGFREPTGGWFEVEKTRKGKSDPLLEGMPDVFKVFQLHGETVGLTPSMACLGRGRFCKNQIVKVRERAYGIQGHVELSEGMFVEWLGADKDLRKMDARKLREDFEAVFCEFQKGTEVIFKNFLKKAGILG